VATYRGGAELWQSSDSDPITTATPSTPATYDINGRTKVRVTLRVRVSVIVSVSVEILVLVGLRSGLSYRAIVRVMAMNLHCARGRVR
jgi:hypothetical protein